MAPVHGPPHSPSHTQALQHDLQEITRDRGGQTDQEQKQEQEQEQKQEEEDKGRRLQDQQVREQEGIDWSISDRTARPDSYLVEAASRISGQKSFQINDQDLDVDMFCGFSLRQMRQLQKCDPDLRIVRHWVLDKQ